MSRTVETGRAFVNPPRRCRSVRSNRPLIGSTRGGKDPARSLPHEMAGLPATRLLNAGAERVDIQALLGHSTINTTQIDNPVNQDRMAAVVHKR